MKTLSLNSLARKLALTLGLLALLLVFFLNAMAQRVDYILSDWNEEQLLWEQLPDSSVIKKQAINSIRAIWAHKSDGFLVIRVDFIAPFSQPTNTNMPVDVLLLNGDTKRSLSSLPKWKQGKRSLNWHYSFTESAYSIECMLDLKEIEFQSFQVQIKQETGVFISESFDLSTVNERASEPSNNQIEVDWKLITHYNKQHFASEEAGLAYLNQIVRHDPDLAIIRRANFDVAWLKELQKRAYFVSQSRYFIAFSKQHKIRSYASEKNAMEFFVGYEQEASTQKLENAEWGLMAVLPEFLSEYDEEGASYTKIFEQLKAYRSGTQALGILPMRVPLIMSLPVSNPLQGAQLSDRMQIYVESVLRHAADPKELHFGLNVASATRYPAAINISPKYVELQPNLPTIHAYTKGSLQLISGTLLDKADAALKEFLDENKSILEGWDQLIDSYPTILNFKRLALNSKLEELLAQNDDGIPVFYQSEMQLHGVVHLDSKHNESGPVYIKTKAGGLALYGNKMDEYTVGDSLSVAGKLDFIGGQPSMFLFDQEDIQKIGPGNVQVSEVSVDELLDGAASSLLNKMEGQMVRIHGLKIKPNQVWESGKQYALDAELPQIQVHIRPEYIEDMIRLKKPIVAIEGLLTQFDSNAPFNEGFEIIPITKEAFIEAEAAALELRFAENSFEEEFYEPNKRLPINWDSEGITFLNIDYRLQQGNWISIASSIDAKEGRYDSFTAPEVVNDSLYIRLSDTEGQWEVVSKPIWIYDREQALRNGEGPLTFALLQNYPNPFNPITQIGYTLPENAFVRIEVYNSIGQQVDILVQEVQNAGYHEVNWNGSNQTTGIYIYKMMATSATSSFVQIKKMTLVK